MESENSRRVRKGYDAFNRGDFDSVLELMHPDIEVQRADMAPDTTPVRGLEAVRTWLMPDVFEEQHVEVEDIVENGEKMLVSGHFRVQASGSGIVWEDRAFHVWTIRDDKAVRLEFYAERSEAVAAAGLASRR